MIFESECGDSPDSQNHRRKPGQLFWTLLRLQTLFDCSSQIIRLRERHATFLVRSEPPSSRSWARAGPASYALQRSDVFLKANSHFSELLFLQK